MPVCMTAKLVTSAVGRENAAVDMAGLYGRAEDCGLSRRRKSKGESGRGAKCWTKAGRAVARLPSKFEGREGAFSKTSAGGAALETLRQVWESELWFEEGEAVNKSFRKEIHGTKQNIRTGCL